MWQQRLVTRIKVDPGSTSAPRFCSVCVMSDQRPGVTLRERKYGHQKEKRSLTERICAECESLENNGVPIDWQLRESHLQQILSRFRRSDGEYDVIVPASGGKFSAFIAHLLKNEYGMNPDRKSVV